MRVKVIAIAAAGLVAAVAALAYGAEMYAEGAAARQVDAALARPPFAQATHGTVSYSFLRGHLTVADVAAELSGGTPRKIHVGRLEVDGISRRAVLGNPGDSLAVGEMRLEDVAIESDNDKVHIDAMVATEPLVSDLAALAGPVDAGTLIAHLSAAKLELAGVRRSADKPMIHSEATFEHVTATRIDHGKVASGVVANAVTAGTAKEPEPLETHIEMGEETFSDLDLSALQRCIAMIDDVLNCDFKGSATASHVKLSILSEKINPGPVTATIDRMTINGVHTRFDHVPLHPDKDSGGALDSFGGMSMTADRIQVGKVAVAVPGVNPVTVDLGDFEVDGLSADIVDPRKRRPYVFVSRVRIGDLDAGPGERKVGLKQLQFTMAGTAEEPTASALKVSGFHLPASIAPPIKLAGYDGLDADLALDLAIDRSQAQIESHGELAVAQAGTIGTSLSIVGDPGDPASLDLERLAATRLKQAELRYEDKSLLERLMRVYARQTKRDLDAVREQAIQEVEAQRDALADKPQLAQALQVVADFLRKPGTITVAVKPPEPPPLLTLSAQAKADPITFANELGLTVR